MKPLDPAHQSTCTEEHCFLPALENEVHCMLHVRRDNKCKTDLAAAFRAYEGKGIKQIFNAYFVQADLSGSYLENKNFLNCDFRNADFSKARLTKIGFDFSNLEGCNFEDTILERCDLRLIASAQQMQLARIIFDHVRLPSFKKIGLKSVYETGPNPDFHKAKNVYQNLKECYRTQGQIHATGLYYEQEMHMRRKTAKSFSKAWLTLVWLLCGYGEGPVRAFASFVVTIMLFAGGYTLCTLEGPDGTIEGDYLQALYFSVVTFTSLGYGDIRPVGIARLLAGMEALVGIFLISLFVFVFCRKMIR